MAKSAADQIKDALRQQVSPKKIQAAAARALNKSMTSVRAEASKLVREELTSLKAADAKEPLAIEKAKASSGIANMVAALVVSAKAMELYKFAPRVRKVKTSRGDRQAVSVKVKEQRKTVVGGFVATMRSGKTGIWKRTGGTTSAGKSRIKLLFTTKVSDVFRNDDFIEKLQAFARARLETVFAQEINYEIQKGRK